MKISTPPIRFLKLVALFILCAVFSAPSAHAQQAIKMLPPTNCPFVTQAQINAGASNVWGVLGWDSKNPLSCVPNFQFSDNGYTGIGSAGAQPQALLDLYGDYDYSYPTPGPSHLGNLHMDPTNNIAPTNDGWGTAITFGGDNGYDASAEAGIYVQYSNAVYANGSPGTKMYFGTSDSYPTGAQIRMTIDNLGNVGIGTTVPLATLDVRGTFQNSTNQNGTLPTINTSVSSAGGTYIGWNGMTGTPAETDFINIFRNSGNTYSGGFAFFNMSSTTAVATTPLMYINGSGNVGIGTTVPAAPLDVNGAMRATGSTTVSGTAYPTVESNPCTPPGAIAYDATNDAPVYCSSTTNKWAAINPIENRTWHSILAGSNGVASARNGQNTYGYPIEIAAIMWDCASPSQYMQVFVGPSSANGGYSNPMIEQCTLAGGVCPLYVTVPSGQYWYLNNQSGNCTEYISLLY
jgi:hypothetical protein